MTMTFSLHENIEFIEPAKHLEIGAFAKPKTESGGKGGEIYLFADKLRVPEFKISVSRPRLNELLAKSSVQFGATLICGRSGTGKTALAADYAREYKNVAWYTVESADTDWATFSSYLTASIFGPGKNFGEIETDSMQEKISAFFANLFFQSTEISSTEPLLLVIDDLHHIFDVAWFNDFFNLILYSLPENVHLLLLCRSKPLYPLWRLRSKQVLNVVDEKLLALSPEEAVELYQKFGLTKEKAKKAHRDCFGRISKLMLSIKSTLAG